MTRRPKHEQPPIDLRQTMTKATGLAGEFALIATHNMLGRV